MPPSETHLRGRKLSDHEVAREAAVDALARLHRAQAAFYAGGHPLSLRKLLCVDVVWHVPGNNLIAGTYRGIDEVMSYFSARRELAGCTFRLHPRDVLVGEGPVVAALTDGTALIAGNECRWSTVGLYRFRNGLISECRLVPFDLTEFDRIWKLP
jgi:ketosteroid isomerase-like protein